MSTAMTGLLLASAFLFEGVKTHYAKTFRYDKPDCAPVWWGGESRSVEAYGSDYCIFLDIIYTDGTGAWQKWAKLTAGTHGEDGLPDGWQEFSVHHENDMMSFL